MSDDKSIPSIDELTAKQERLANEVSEATTALDTAKSTFAASAKSDPTAVETLLELATGVKTAEGTVTAAQRAVSKCQTDIDGIRYDEAMGGVISASTAIKTSVTKPMV
ncbi:hypothetical protein LCGC14_2655650, partial [marine sediment metagenome]